MTESIAQDYGLLDSWILVFVTSVCENSKSKSVQEHTLHY